VPREVFLVAVLTLRWIVSFQDTLSPEKSMSSRKKENMDNVRFTGKYMAGVDAKVYIMFPEFPYGKVSTEFSTYSPWK
jgi:hypothetical protein